MWEVFRKYHYLNTDLNPMCRQFVGVMNGELVCHTGVIPTPMTSDSKRLHRSVVLPDYQGIGIGMNFKNAVCDIIRKEGWGGANLERNDYTSAIPCPNKKRQVETGKIRARYKKQRTDEKRYAEQDAG